jgi:Secretion system C-terminal sorting domain
MTSFSPYSEEYLFTGSGGGLWRIRLGAGGEAVGGWEMMQVHALPVNRPPSVPEIRRLRFITESRSAYQGDLLLGTWGQGVIRLDNPTASSTGAFRQMSNSGQVQALVPSLDDKVIVGLGYEGIHVFGLGVTATGLGSTNPTPVSNSETWNYPNPFSTSTTVTFELSSPTTARIDVFDALGRIVSSPLRGTFLGPGMQHIRVDGSTLSPGMYFYRLSLPGRTEMHQMVISR